MGSWAAINHQKVSFLYQNALWAQIESSNNSAKTTCFNKRTVRTWNIFCVLFHFVYLTCAHEQRNYWYNCLQLSSCKLRGEVLVIWNEMELLISVWPLDYFLYCLFVDKKKWLWKYFMKAWDARSPIGSRGAHIDVSNIRNIIVSLPLCYVIWRKHYYE